MEGSTVAIAVDAGGVGIIFAIAVAAGAVNCSCYRVLRWSRDLRFLPVLADRDGRSRDHLSTRQHEHSR